MVTATGEIFVSYNRRDRQFVDDICVLLQENGVRYWRDGAEIDPGDKWLAAIERAIRGSRIALVAVGPNGVGNTQQTEVEICFRRNTAGEMVLVPVLLPGVDDREVLMDVLATYDYVDFRDGFSAEMTRRPAADGSAVACAPESGRRRNGGPPFRCLSGRARHAVRPPGHNHPRDRLRA